MLNGHSDAHPAVRSVELHECVSVSFGVLALLWWRLSFLSRSRAVATFPNTADTNSRTNYSTKKSNTSNQDLGDVSFSLCLRLLLLKYFVSFLPVFLLVCSCTCVCFEATGLSRCFKTCTAALKEHNLRMHLSQLVGTSLN